MRPLTMTFDTRSHLKWHYEDDQMVHDDCGGEVLWIKDSPTSGGYICAECGAQDDA